MKTMQYLLNVATLRLDTDKCIGCGLCATVCPHGVFRIVSQKAQIIDKDSCMECGACGRNCPVSAIDVKAGVGCAAAVIQGVLRNTEPHCDSCCGGKSK
jgi:NAD-dependent dihydropyrimidine dehydrogenase PreA subunit